jgi:predicted transcriptional regulator
MQGLNRPLMTIPELDVRRHKAGLRATDLCERAGVHHRTWYEGLRGRGTTTTVLRKLMDALEEMEREGVA